MNRFDGVYLNALWAKSGCTLSGPGSALKACLQIAGFINRIHPTKVLDLGCGDLNWVSSVEGILTGEIDYFGVDVVDSLIAHHKRVFPWFKGMAADIETLEGDQGAEMILLKDVLFHLNNENVSQILKNVSGWPSWKFLMVTSHRKAPWKQRPRLAGMKMAPIDIEALPWRLGEVKFRFRRPTSGEVLVFVR